MTTVDATAGAPGKKRLNLAPIQKFGRSLMLPIAALPVAALLLRFGPPDMLGADGLGWDKVAAVLFAGGNALFANLPLLFAVGVAIGMAKKADGSTALAAVVGYLVFKGVGDAMSPFVLGLPAEGEDQELVNYGVLGGILCGLIAAWLWQRYHRISLPTYLAFFGGRRFVPIVTAFATLVLAVLLRLVYPAFDAGLTSVGEWVANNIDHRRLRLRHAQPPAHPARPAPHPQLGAVVHPRRVHAPGGGDVVHGDINRFLAGDPTAGAFMTGFFPIMMFALPAAALAIWQEAKPAAKKAVGGIMVSAALTSFLTGITEPLEFAFMFVAWPLYVIHAVLTGTSLAIANALGHPRRVRLLAPGLIDYLLNFEDRREAAAAHRHGAGLRRDLLRAVPLRHPPVEPAHPGPRGRGRGVGGLRPRGGTGRGDRGRGRGRGGSGVEHGPS